jgi:hypothetical protein
VRMTVAMQAARRIRQRLRAAGAQQVAVHTVTSVRVDARAMAVSELAGHGLEYARRSVAGLIV